MADESIVIEIQDKVSSSISTKIQRIGTDARSANADVEKLKTALAGLNSNAMTAIASGARTANSELAKAAISSQKLATEQQKTALAAARLATEQQRTAAATALANAAQGQAAVSAARLATEQQRTAAATTAAATAQTRATTAQTQGATATQRLATETQRTAVQTANATAASDRAALAALRLKKAQDDTAASAGKVTTALGDQVRQWLTIAAAGATVMKVIQLGDAYTTLQNKLQTVATSQGQVNLLTNELFELANRTRSGIDETATAFTRFDRSLMQMGKSQQETLRMTETINKALIVGGATTQEASAALLQLSQAFNSGRLQGDEFRSVSENMPMVLDAVAKVLKVNTAQVKELGSEGKITAQVLFEAFKSIESQVDSTFAKTIPTVAQAWTVLTNNITQYIGEANKASGFTEGLSKLILELASVFKDLTKESKNAGDQMSAVDLILMAILEVFKVVIVIGSDVVFVFKSIGTEIGGIAAQLVSLSKLDLKGFNVIGDAMKADAANARKELDAFQARIMAINTNRPKAAASNDTAGATLRGSGKNTIGTPTDKKALKAAENRALALQKVNAQLDNELDRLGMLKDARDAQQRFDQLEESFIQRKIKLTGDESASIKERIAAIQDGLKIQAAQDQIYSDLTGAVERYNNEQIAIIRLTNQKAITDEQAAEALLKSEEAYKNAIDPMRQYNRDLDQQITLVKMLPKEREIEQQVMQVTNDLLAKGKKLTDDEVTALRSKLEVLQQLNMVSQQEAALMDASVSKREQFAAQLQAIQNLRNNAKSGFGEGDAAGATNDMLKSMGLDTSTTQVGLEASLALYQTYYDQINQLRQANLISETDAAKLAAQVSMQEQTARLAQTQSFLTQLSGLQNSNSKKLAAVGKAAAITQAVINTYQSATGAYSAMASIPYVGPVLGAAAAAAAIAAGMANVQAIRSQSTGFQSGGYTGDIARNAVAGAVHGQEYVFDAPAVDRIGVANLEAMRQGRAMPAQAPAAQGNTTNGDSKTPRIINLLDPAMVGDFLATPEGEQVFVNTIRKNADSIRATIGNG